VVGGCRGRVGPEKDGLSRVKEVGLLRCLSVYVLVEKSKVALWARSHAPESRVGECVGETRKVSGSVGQRGCGCTSKVMDV